MGLRDPESFLSAADLIQVSLMAAGIGTILHVVQIKLPYGYVYGTGLISVVGEQYSCLTVLKGCIVW